MDDRSLIEAYLDRVRAQLQGVAPAEVDNLIVEIRGHLIEQATALGGAANAIARMGDAREFAASYRDELFIAVAANGHSPLRLVRAIFRASNRGIRWALIAGAGLVGYALSFVLLAASIAKPFAPDRIGLWWGLQAKPTGFYDGPWRGSRELLGGCFIPAGLALGLILALITTALLRIALRHPFRRETTANGHAALWLLLFFSMSAVSMCRADDGPPPRWTSDDAAQTRTRIEAILREERVPGAAIAVLQDRRVVSVMGVGAANLKTQEPVTGSTRFRAGSITKGVIAFSLVVLEREGRIVLDSPLREIAPEIPCENPWNKTHPVTIREVLEHTAGFDDSHFNEYFSRDPNVETMPLQQVLAINPRSRVVRWEPGTRFSYSNVDYTIGAYLIEKLTGLPYERFIQDRVLKPIGIMRAVLRLSDADGEMAQGYDEHGEPAPALFLYHRPAGALVISAEDLGKLVEFFLLQGEAARGPLSNVGILEMEEPKDSIAARHGLRVGYGTGLLNDHRLHLLTYGHDGGLPGFFSAFRYQPKYGIGFVVLLNGTSRQALYRIEDLIFQRLIEGLNVHPMDNSPLAQPLINFVGHYASASYRPSLAGFYVNLHDRMEVSVQNGKLILHRPFETGRELIAVGPETFRFAEDADPSVLIADNDGEHSVLVVGSEYYEASSRGLWLLQLAILGCWVIALPVSLAIGVRAAFLACSKRSLRAEELALLVPLAALVAAALAVTRLQFDSVGVLDWQTTTICISGWAFFVSSIMLFGLLLFGVAGHRISLRGIAVTTCSALNLVVAVYLWHWNLVGLKLWNW